MYIYTVLASDPIYKINKELTLADSKVNVNSFDQRTAKQLTAEGDLSHNDFSYESDIVHTALLVTPLILWCALIASLLLAFFRAEINGAGFAASTDETKQKYFEL